MRFSKRQREIFFITVVFLLFGLLVFYQTALFDFLHYDDDLYVVNNPSLRNGLTKQGLSWPSPFLPAPVGFWLKVVG